MPETIKHLFWDCPVIKQLILNFFENHEHIEVYLNCETFILGIRDKKEIVTNLLFIYLKRYIYNCKIQEIVPTISRAKHYVNYQYKVQKEVAVKTGNCDSFDKNWEKYINIFI